MQKPPEVTKPGAIRRRPETVTLPVEQDGAQIVLRMQALTFAEITLAEGEMPTIHITPDAARQMSASESAAFALKLVRFAQASVLEPPFWFGVTPEEPRCPAEKADWGALAAMNQVAVMLEAYRLSGITVPKRPGAGSSDGESAAALGTFPPPVAVGKVGRAPGGAGGTAAG